MATGRSDYPNQVNNVLGFPYIFRGALDVRATTINMEMKIAASRALADLAREDVPDEVASAYGARPKYGPEYIIPVPFDPRLIFAVPAAIAKAAMDTGVARKPITDMNLYREQLRSRRDPAAGVLATNLRAACGGSRSASSFAEGEEEQVIRAAASFVHQGLGSAILVGREDRVRETAKNAGIELWHGIEIHNARLSHRNATYAAYLYERLQRKGYLPRDCQRLVNQDRNHFAACMVALRRRRCDGHRRHPKLLRRPRGRAALHRRQAGPSRDGRVAGAGARAHHRGGGHGRHRDAGCPGACRDRNRGSRRLRAISASSRASRCSPSQPSGVRPAIVPHGCRRR